MTTKQVREIIDLRKSGYTYQVIADMVGCCKGTVRTYLVQAGMADPNFTAKKQAKTAMLLHDWNTGAKSAVLVRKYRYRNRNAMYQTISWLRGKGWPFEYRQRLNKQEGQG